ncbi:MAG TPA: biopolymer transporter ExbD [Myxococcaceae bacterium]|jgi:biopolymer transport protein ExbD
MSKPRKVQPNSGVRPNSDINVTPLVDVVLVLLIIFMVVTPLLEKDIEVKVPDTEKSEEITEPPADQLVVGITPTGELSINMEKVSEEEYEAKLERILKAKKKGEKLVFFMPDVKTNYAKLVTALDGARQAGAETLGMMTEDVPVPGQNDTPGAPGAPPGGGTPTNTTP